ncbi:MAG: SDR family oxidoreductase [Rubrivivax sp.]|nr:SDR family oxidoreductase [Rubrivivax sp.]
MHSISAQPPHPRRPSDPPQALPAPPAAAPPAGAAPTCLLLGAGGFIGAHIAAALRRGGWRVVAAVRPRPQLRADERGCDLARWVHAEDWLPLLDGIDAIVNAAGILRERGADTFAAIHHHAPLALAEAAARRSITQFVQISALGDAADGEFVASKHRFDAALAARLPQALVLRPSVVYSATGSYGGTSLLRSLAAFPPALLLPGHGQWQMQPLAAEDLADLVVQGLAQRQTGCHEVGGPAAMTLAQYQRQWRLWLGGDARREWHVPVALVDRLVALSEPLGRGPLGRTTWRMLQRGNTLAPGAFDALVFNFGDRAPRALGDVLAATPAQVQDRWHALLHPLAPVLKLAIAALWLLSAAAGWLTPATTIEAMAAGSPMARFDSVALARVAGAVDLALGLWLCASRRPRAVVAWMIATVLAYTVVFGFWLPSLWLDPLGGLAKNLALLPALAVLWVLVERR